MGADTMTEGKRLALRTRAKRKGAAAARKAAGPEKIKALPIASKRRPREC